MGIGEAERSLVLSALVFTPPSPSDRHHEEKSRCDLFLDTFPFNGHTSVADALWSQTPVLTLAEERWASRVAASLLLSHGSRSEAYSLEEAPLFQQSECAKVVAENSYLSDAEQNERGKEELRGWICRSASQYEETALAFIRQKKREKDVSNKERQLDSNSADGKGRGVFDVASYAVHFRRSLRLLWDCFVYKTSSNGTFKNMHIVLRR